MSKIQFELAPKPTKAEKQAPGKSGFVVVATRWVIERSKAWMERCKSLVKNFEQMLEHATAKINLCFIRLMLKRLAANLILNGFYIFKPRSNHAGACPQSIVYPKKRTRDPGKPDYD